MHVRFVCVLVRMNQRRMHMHDPTVFMVFQHTFFYSSSNSSNQRLDSGRQMADTTNDTARSVFMCIKTASVRSATTKSDITKAWLWGKNCIFDENYFLVSSKFSFSNWSTGKNCVKNSVVKLVKKFIKAAQLHWFSMQKLYRKLAVSQTVCSSFLLENCSQERIARKRPNLAQLLINTVSPKQC